MPHRLWYVCVGGDEVITTDIDRTKRIFRRRGWVSRFFKANRICAEDFVLLEQLGPYDYRISRAEAQREVA
jgi:DNA polymerase-3 subunit epsilon